MVNITEVINTELSERIHDHDTKGGALRINVFEISKNYLGELPDEYTAHLSTARQSLEKQNHASNMHWNKVAPANQRAKFPIAQIDYEKLDPSGKKLTIKNFLGPHFDLESHKPFVKGQLGNATGNSYFYYDVEEIPNNKIDIQNRIEAYEDQVPEYKGNFIKALMEPPYNIQLGRDIKVRGNYILDFLQYFFDDLSMITVYAWDTNCSVIFDPGKEWWGSYFWTVYNPAKGWYIGIIASETD